MAKKLSLEGKGLKAWESIRRTGERLEVVIEGGAIAARQYLFGTNLRVLIVKIPLLPFQSPAVADFPFKQINGIAFELGLGDGYVAVLGPGYKTPSGFSYASIESMGMPNVLPLSRLLVKRSEVESQVKKLRELIDSHSHQTAQTTPQLVSRADELAKLKQLFDSGVLSAEEFAAEKRRLLES